jgi:hypothetical protein
VPYRKGKPHKLTAAVEREICASLEIGLPKNLAAEGAGISERTFHNWCQQGREGTEPYASFLSAVERARAIGAKYLFARVLKGEKGSGGAQWALERCFPREFGARMMLGGIPDGDPIRIDTTDRIRESPEACKLLHQAIVASVEAFTDASIDRPLTADGKANRNGEPES